MTTPLSKVQLAITYLEDALADCKKIGDAEVIADLKNLVKEAYNVTIALDALPKTKEKTKPKAVAKTSKLDKSKTSVVDAAYMKKFWIKIEKEDLKDGKDNFNFYNVDANYITKLGKKEKPTGRSLQKNWWLFHVKGHEMVGICGKNTTIVHAIMDELLGDCEGEYPRPVWGPAATDAATSSTKEKAEESDDDSEDEKALTKLLEHFETTVENKIHRAKIDRGRYWNEDGEVWFYNVDSNRTITVKDGKKPSAAMIKSKRWYRFTYTVAGETIEVGMCGENRPLMNAFFKEAGVDAILKTW